MIIHLYAICWNELSILRFFFRHYEPWIDRFVLFDDGSKDGTLELLRSKRKVEVRQFLLRHPDSFVLSEKALHDECWKESRGAADWVVVTDVDEHIYHPRLAAYLEASKRRGVTYIPALGVDIVTEAFPGAGENRARTRTIGAPTPQSSKLRIFAPDAMQEVDVGVGGHDARPSGRLALPDRDELLLLHYRHLGVNYVLPRYNSLAHRLKEQDVKNRWGWQYRSSPEEYMRQLADLKGNLVDVVNWRYQPWRDHREPR